MALKSSWGLMGQSLLPWPGLSGNLRAKEHPPGLELVPWNILDSAQLKAQESAPGGALTAECSWFSTCLWVSVSRLPQPLELGWSQLPAEPRRVTQVPNSPAPGIFTSCWLGRWKLLERNPKRIHSCFLQASYTRKSKCWRNHSHPKEEENWRESRCLQ